MSQKDITTTTERFPTVSENQDTEQSSINKSSLFSNVDFKQGITLDKVLGGQFKKIEICDKSIKEFEKQDHDGLKERRNENTEFEEKEYQYESFEILETDDEEDTISDIHRSKEEKEMKYSQRKGIAEVQENHEVLSRIQNKYKSSKPKFLPKTKQKGLRSRSPLREKVEEINTEGEQLKEREEMNKRRERISSTRTESKSSSPKFGYGQYPLRFPSFVYDQVQSQNDVTPPASSDPATKELMKNSSSPGQFATQTQTSFRGGGNSFQTTNENFRNTNEKFRTSIMKKTFYKPMGNMNPSLVGFGEKDQIFERTGSRSNSLAVTMRQVDNSTKFQIEKPSGQNLEQKFMRETRMITEKIKQSEKEMMDKYAKMFKLDHKESKKYIFNGLLILFFFSDWLI